MLLSSQPVFTPANLYGMSAWYDATQQATGAVSSWTDQSGFGNHATQSTGAQQPVCTTNQLNGKNVILFTASSNQTLVVPSSVYPVAAGSNTLFAVCKRNTEAGNIQLVINGGLGAGSTVYGLYYEAAAGTATYRQNGLCQTTGNTNTNYNVFTGSFDGTVVLSQSVNNAGTITNNNGGVETLVNMHIGSETASGLYLDGGIAEIIIYKRLLSASEITVITQYLSNKWRVP